MSASLSRPQIAGVTVALLGLVAYMLSQPRGVEGAHAWLARDVPWLARLLDRYPVLVNLGTCWMLWRESRMPPAPLVLLHFAVALQVLKLPMNLVLGLLLGLLTAVALVARPWPNRVIIGRCIVLAALAIAVDAVAH